MTQVDTAAPPPPLHDGRAAVSRRGCAAWIVLLLVCMAMVYGTWLAVDDMRAKPMLARVDITGDAVTIVNDSGFTWSDTVFTINGAYTAAAATPIEPGSIVSLPLAAFVDAQGRTLTWTRPPVHEVAAAATRKARFPAFNVDHATTGRWPVP
jgi:hypothetical protein